VSYLAEQHGWSSIAELYRRVPPNTDVTTFDREFANLYSVTMDQAWSEALDEPGGAACQIDWPCVATAFEPDSTAVPDCDGQFHRRIELTQLGGMELSVSGTDSALRLLDCSTPTPAIYELLGGNGTPAAIHWASLPAGAYTLFQGLGDLPSRVEFRARLASDWINATCADAALVTLDPSGETSIDMPTGTVPFDGSTSSDGSAWIRLDGGHREYDVSTVDLSWTGIDPEGTLELCESCDATECLPIIKGGVVRSPISGTAALRVRHAYSLPPPSEAWGHIFLRPASTE
jgi:hypothetical protein